LNLRAKSGKISSKFSEFQCDRNHLRLGRTPFGSRSPDSMSEMKIVMVCGFALSPKATVRARAVPMAQALIDRGHQVTVLVSPYDNPAFSGQETREAGVLIRNLRFRTLPVIKYLRIPFDFLGEIREIDPDIIHIFKPKGFSGLTAILLHLQGRRAFVLDHDDWEGWGGWNETAPHSRPVKHLINFQERWIPRHARAITVASRLLEERLLQAEIPREKVFYVPNGPKQSFKGWAPPSQGNIETLRSQSGFQSRVVIWYAGHMDAADEPLRALGVLAEVVKDDRRAAVWVAGPVRRELQDFVQENGLSQDIIFLGWLQYENYLRHLVASDIVFYPFPDTPVYRAKCSGKVIEYMCLGKPLVTTPVGQNVEYLENEESGLMAKEQSTLALALARLVNDSALREKLGRRARRRIWEKFGWDKMIEGVLRAYDLALMERRSRSPH
jgi:glycosyltransferase involved in cell wall biosynthesis